MRYTFYDNGKAATNKNYPISQRHGLFNRESVGSLWEALLWAELWIGKPWWDDNWEGNKISRFGRTYEIKLVELP